MHADSVILLVVPWLHAMSVLVPGVSELTILRGAMCVVVFLYSPIGLAILPADALCMPTTWPSCTTAFSDDWVKDHHVDVQST